MSDDSRELDECEHEACSCSNEASQDDSAGCNPMGCFSIVLIGLAFWALVFGVTVNGRHYGVAGCNTEQGIKINK